MKTHIHRVPIEWGDADPARIVFYPRYFAWFDAGTPDCLQTMDKAGDHASDGR